MPSGTRSRVGGRSDSGGRGWGGGGARARAGEGRRLRGGAGQPETRAAGVLRRAPLPVSVFVFQPGPPHPPARNQRLLLQRLVSYTGVTHWATTPVAHTACARVPPLQGKKTKKTPPAMCSPPRRLAVASILLALLGHAAVLGDPGDKGALEVHARSRRPPRVDTGTVSCGRPHPCPAFLASIKTRPLSRPPTTPPTRSLTHHHPATHHPPSQTGSTHLLPARASRRRVASTCTSGAFG